ncbi:Mitogen-Activated Protein Kinase Kinase Kinase 14 [Manis pentadactyla]|nr:Mitogen-Activated Protein Kinase Kinase Kinase 14 [Manis pentadactyla]
MRLPLKFEVSSTITHSRQGTVPGYMCQDMRSEWKPCCAMGSRARSTTCLRVYSAVPGRGRPPLPPIRLLSGDPSSEMEKCSGPQKQECDDKLET